MAKYINRQTLLQTLNENKIPYNADVNYFITNAPVIEVVRCKDCQHYFQSYGHCNKHSGRCDRHSEDPDQSISGFGFSFWVNEDDFCSYGEK